MGGAHIEVLCQRSVYQRVEGRIVKPGPLVCERCSIVNAHAVRKGTTGKFARSLPVLRCWSLLDKTMRLIKRLFTIVFWCSVLALTAYMAHAWWHEHMRLALAALHSSEIDLAHTRIMAPITGILGNRAV